MTKLQRLISLLALSSAACFAAQYAQASLTTNGGQAQTSNAAKLQTAGICASGDTGCSSPCSSSSSCASADCGACM